MRLRKVLFETLTPRHLLTAEGDAFDLSEVIDATGLDGNLSATIDWGDGSRDAGVIAPSGNGSLTVRLDYSLDSNGFFDTQSKKDLLASAVDSVVRLLGDDLAAIVPGGSNSWEAIFGEPATGMSRQVRNLSLAADEIVVYVGGRDLGSGVLALGGPGAFQVYGSSAFVSTVSTRGEENVSGPGARDFAPWGGSISFSTTANWHFGETEEGLDAYEVDFVTVAAHEFAHVLGIGTADSWTGLIDQGRFTGSASVAAYDGAGNVPLSPDLAHWAEGITDGGRPVAMDPYITLGTRTPFTALDFAGLDDIGWDLLSPLATVSGTHRYADNGTWYGQITLSGDSGGVITKPFEVVVDNAPPTLKVTDDLVAVTGTLLDVLDIGVFTDPGFSNPSAEPPGAETFLYGIDWGDGSEPSAGTATVDTAGGPGVLTQGSLDGRHTYTAPGWYTVTVTVQDDDGGSAVQTLQVQVIDPTSLELSLVSSFFSENAGPAATVAIVSRIDADNSAPLEVTLTSDDPSEAAVPTSVTIPAGQASVALAVDAVDDTLLDGDQTVTIVASASGCDDATVILTVADHETLAVTIDKTFVLEGAGPSAALGTVTRSNTDVDLPLTVNLVSSDETEASVASSVVIPAGQSSVSFGIDAVADDLADGTQAATIEASAEGYESGNAALWVVDGSGWSWQNPGNRHDVDNNGQVEPLDVLSLINAINRDGTYVLPPVPPPGQPALFLDVDGDGRLSAADVLDVINFLNAWPGGEAEPPNGATGSAGQVSNDPSSVALSSRSAGRNDVAVLSCEQPSKVTVLRMTTGDSSVLYAQIETARMAKPEQGRKENEGREHHLLHPCSSFAIRASALSRL